MEPEDDDAIDNDDLTTAAEGDEQQAPPPEATDAGPRVTRLPKPQATEPSTGDEPKKPTRLVSELRPEPAAPPEDKRAAEPPAVKGEPDELTRLKQERDQLNERLSRLEQRAAEKPSPREPGDLPPPEEVDPDDVDTVKLVARAQMNARDPEAAAWRSEYSKLGTELEPLTTELKSVDGDVIALQRALDPKKSKEFGLPELDDLAREGLETRLQTALSRKERLEGRIDKYESKREDLAARYQNKFGAWMEAVRNTVINKRQATEEAATRVEEESAADSKWQSSLDEALAGLPKDVDKDEVETYLLARADVIYNDLHKEIPNLTAWMKEKVQKLYGARNVAVGASDVQLARLRERDARQSAPRGRAAVAVRPAAQTLTPEERRREADRRTALMARSIKAVHR